MKNQVVFELFWKFFSASCCYTPLREGHNQWRYLYEYVNQGEVEIDNNWVENQIRPFALGRRNWLFLGNEKSAAISARYYSLIQTCILNDINPRQYLNYIFTQVHRLRRKEIEAESLLPQFIDKTLLV